MMTLRIIFTFGAVLLTLATIGAIIIAQALWTGESTPSDHNAITRTIFLIVGDILLAITGIGAMVLSIGLRFFSEKK